MKLLLKPLVFVGNSEDDLFAFPKAVKRVVGYALYDAQRGAKSANAKPLKGFGGATVLEVVSDFSTNTYRAVYTVKFGSAVYVLHAFQKKSPKGGKVATLDKALIEARLKEAKRLHELSVAHQHETVKE